ncbi:MAG TPA: cupin domain-containing protein [Vicinamibacterales bacterium]|nr:cupin domain-containing protein [Vicinamibacterales bacterium]
MRTTIVAAALATGFGLALPLIATVQPEPVTYHDMSVIPIAPYGPYPEARAIVAGNSSLIIFKVVPGYHQAIHHHDQEQVSMNLGGSLGYSIGGVVHQLGARSAVLPPSNVEHGMFNDSDQPTTGFEYQPVRRTEWLPPHPPQAPPQPQSPTPLPLPANQPVAIDFDWSSSGWRVQTNGARVKVLSGQTIRATFCDLSQPGAAIDVAAATSTRERFVFVVDGQVTSRVGSTSRAVSREMLIEIPPSSKDVGMTSLGKGRALIVIFEYIGR